MNDARRARCALAALMLVVAAACGGEGSGPPVRVVVPSGATFRAVTDSLARAGIVGSPRLFRLYASRGGRDRDVKAGTYLLRRGAGWGSVLDALTEGRGIVRTVRVIEGYSLLNIVPAMAKALDTPTDSVEAAVRDTALLHRLDIPTSTLEGYLYPDTYSFADGTTPRAAVEEMVRGFERRWKPEWDAQLQTLAMSRHDIVTLASIVEKEARLPEERAVISAVYHNRLRAGMRLQADPTVQYALGRHVERVLYRDLEIDSPYNTYKHAGLPPGPIASPGLPSIEAALFPASVPYLYFVATGDDGHHEFRTTFSEHQDAVAAARRAREAQAAESAERSR